MTGVVEAVVVAVLVVSASVAVVGLSAWAVWREERLLTLTGRAPDWVSRRVRRLMGVGLRNVDTELERLIKEARQQTVR